MKYILPSSSLKLHVKRKSNPKQSCVTHWILSINFSLSSLKSELSRITQTQKNSLKEKEKEKMKRRSKIKGKKGAKDLTSLAYLRRSPTCPKLRIAFPMVSPFPSRVTARYFPLALPLSFYAFVIQNYPTKNNHKCLWTCG